MHGRKINAKTEQRTHAPSDGLKLGWEGTRPPPGPDHQARALHPIDPGGGGHRINSLTGLHLHQIIRVLDHEEHVGGVHCQDQPHLQFMQHQPCQPLAKEMKEGLNGQNLQLTRQWVALMHPSPEVDRCGQGPVESDQTLCGGVQHLEKTHKPGPEAKCPQSAQEIPVVHPVERLLLIQGQEGD
ncbi:unnamed protein product [Caretta caretta]